MAANKKRKLEMMSAFAARQQLWTGSAAEQPSEPVTDDGDGMLQPTRSETPSARSMKRQSAEEAAVGSESRPETSVPVKQHSSFRPNKKNLQRKAGGRLVLSTPDAERLVILGSYGVKVREGEASIAGAILTPSDNIQWVHAPHCHAIPVLRTADETVLELQPHPAAGTLRQLSKLNPAFSGIWNETQEAGSGGSKSRPTFQIIYTSEDAPKRTILQELASPAEWNKKLSALAAAGRKITPVVFICGPKSSGKSTFGRLVANRLMTDRAGSKNRPWSSMMVLDLDPGQPEYCPPGVISLCRVNVPNLSPSFCHPSLERTEGQLRAHAIASVTPATDPSHFIECALNLFGQYQRSPHPVCPLVVNTPGWIQGTGLDILTELIAAIRPTEVIYLSQDGPDDTVSSLQSSCGSSGTFFCTLPSQPSDISSARTPLLLRTMQTMSYFHLRPAPPQQPPSWDPTPLSALRPWSVRYAGRRGFLGILCYDHQPAPALLPEAINGTVLALVRLESHAALRDLVVPPFPPPLSDHHSNTNPSSIAPNTNNDTNTAPNPNPKTTGTGSSHPTTTNNNNTPLPLPLPLIPNPLGRALSPAHSRLLALVLVRAIDPARHELHLLTPPLLPGDVVAGLQQQPEQLVLVAGRFDTPAWAYAEELYYYRGRSRRASCAPRAEGGGGGDSESDSGSDSDSGEGKSESEQEGEGEAQGEEGEAGRTEVPWVEMLHGSQSRAVGSKVWRVRRDLGRS